MGARGLRHGAGCRSVHRSGFLERLKHLMDWIELLVHDLGGDSRDGLAIVRTLHDGLLSVPVSSGGGGIVLALFE